MHFHDFIQILLNVFKAVNVNVLDSVMRRIAIQRLIMIPPVHWRRDVEINTCNLVLTQAFRFQLLVVALHVTYHG